MAESVFYGMGQIRYTNNSQYMTDLNFSPHYIITNPDETIQKDSGKHYRDVVFYSDDGLKTFSTTQAYYFRIGIPRNLSYDLIFDLKLLKGRMNGGVFEIENRNEYQEVKRFVVTKDETNVLGSSRVLIYPRGGQDKDGDVLVAIANDTWETEENIQDGEVYYIAANNEYRIRNIRNSLQQDTVITLKNDIILNQIWKQEQSSEIVYFDFVFSSKVSDANFNCLLLQLQRNEYDNDIQWTDDNGNSYDGIRAEIDSSNVECYEMINLIKTLDNINTLNNIGVWAHPNMVMAINGEEIRVGQSGYYELNDFDITQLGMAARTGNTYDRFSIDYQYKIQSG